MISRFTFLLDRLRERLWVKPLMLCILSIAGAFVARAADLLDVGVIAPEISNESIKTLLSILSASMLVIATFAVASMVSAYASASSTATPRSFPLVIADDVSQNALSTFIGAFIYSIVSLIALLNNFYGRAGRFTLFVATLVVFAMVILTFVRWMDRIARLGRLGNTIDKVEAATATSIEQRRRLPTLGGVRVQPQRGRGEAVFGNSIGYVQRIDVEELQAFAEEARARIEIAALPGTFAAPGRVLAYVQPDDAASSDLDPARVEKAFRIDHDRTYSEDPRFGLIVLSEIASRALSPAVNDPGTAIDVVNTMVRLFARWAAPVEESGRPALYDRVAVPELSLSDMFDDAFGAIARDGAGTVEVIMRLLKGFEALASIDHASMKTVAQAQARTVLARAEPALGFPEDLDRVRRAARFAEAT